MAEPVRCKGSSLIHSFQYDKEERILRVFFLSGYVYDYFFVPEEVAEELQRLAELGGESLGKWFTKNIKKTFEYQRVKQEDDDDK